MIFDPNPRRPQATAIPVWEMDRIRRRVAVIAARGPLDARGLLTLVEEILSGRGGLDRAAAALGIPRDECLRRWHDVMPDSYRGGIDNQANLLRALRELVAGHAEA